MAAKEGYDSIGIVHGGDIAEAVGGPKESLTKFYDTKLTSELRDIAKKYATHEGVGNIPSAIGDLEQGLVWDNAIDDPNFIAADSAESGARYTAEHIGGGRWIAGVNFGGDIEKIGTYGSEKKHAGL